MHKHIPQWTYGERLRKARQDAGLEQEEMAVRLGVSTGTISNWELGKTQSRKMLDRVGEWAEITGVPKVWLLGVSDQELVAGADASPSTTRYKLKSPARRVITLVQRTALLFRIAGFSPEMVSVSLPLVRPL